MLECCLTVHMHQQLPRIGPNSSRYGIMESSSVPVLALRRSSRKDAGPVLSEAATVELADIELQNIEKRFSCQSWQRRWQVGTCNCFKEFKDG